MKRRSETRWRNSAILFSATVGLGLIAILYLVLEARDLKEKAAEDLGQVAHDNLLWHTSAVTNEANRLRIALLTLRADGPSDDALSRLQLRFDLLWNTTSVALSGRLGEGVRVIDEDRILDGVMSFLREEEGAVMTGSIADEDRLRSAIAYLERVDPALRRLMQSTERAEERRIGAIRTELIKQRKGDSLIAAAIVVISILLSIGVYFNARRELERSEERRASADRVLEAAMSRTRFLTMVSHELRTPMNGVLGMIELMRTTPLTADQKIFVDHAAASAHAMTEVVEALLVLSDIEDGVIKLDRERFDLTELAETVRRRIAPFDHENGGKVVVETEGSGAFLGDLSRLSQIAAFLANYVRGVMAAPVCWCRIACDDDLRITLEVEDEARLTWEIEAIFSAAKPAVEDLSADALTPVAARNLAHLMNGACEVAADGLSRRRIEIRIPEAAAIAEPQQRAAA